MCGEQFAATLPIRRCIGSPPRVRGTAPAKAGKYNNFRITPACAGNSAQRPALPLISWDHPRVCGEQTTPNFHIGHSKGSPPRVRGTVVAARRSGKRSRITPACAGNRYIFHQVPNIPGDHPRVCGEQPPYPQRLHDRKGSPPRVRGTVRLLSKISIIGRITPACAGNRNLRQRVMPTV